MKTTKRIVALFLCVLTAISLLACGKGNEPEKVEKKDFSEFAGIVEDPVTWLENFEKLPIANENMTVDELRQLCVDAFKANLTFHWTPSKPVTYTYTLNGKSSAVTLPSKIAYSGMMYATGVEGGTVGTLYKVLPYYDRETGVVDMEAMGDKFMSILSSACSYGALQGWNRVSNSHGIGDMGSYNIYDSNILTVGPYTYQQHDYNYNFASKTASNEIIAKNGDQVMYESYAAMLPADGFYSSSSWHVMMCSTKPEVVRNADGTINGEESYLHVCEQETSGTKGGTATKRADGVEYRSLGGVDNKFTFQDLLKKGYIPFTLKEFVGQDPVEAGKVWMGTESAPVANGTEMTLADLGNQKVGANYNITNIEITAKKPDGTVLVSYDPSIGTGPRSYEETIGALDIERLSPYANGKNTIHIYVRLANGELLEAFNTTLKVD